MADSTRYQPPYGDPQLQLVAQVLDAVAPLPKYGLIRDAVVNLDANTPFVRLSPLSTGMTAILPTAGAGNTGKRVALVVANGQGTLTVKPASGTINEAASLTFAAGTYLVVLQSDGNTRWATTTMPTGLVTTAMLADAAVTLAKMANLAAATVIGRALGAGTGVPTALTGAQLADILETEGFSWTGAWDLTNRIRWGTAASIFDQTLTGNTDNLAIGAVNTVRIVGAGFNLTGMVPDATGHIVWLQNEDAAANLVLVHNATSTAANRFFLPNNANYTMTPRSAVMARYNGASSRWNISAGAA